MTNTTTKTATKSRKSARKPERTATITTVTDGKLILWLTQDGVIRGYDLKALPSDFGTAYRLGKADNGDGHMEEYDVLLYGRESSCTCPGHNYRGHCKHVEALAALIKAGKLATTENKPQAVPASQFNDFDDP